MGVQGPGHEVNHSHSSNAEVKNEWSHTSSPHLCLRGVNGDNSLQTKTLLLILITVQQDATFSVYYISVGSSTCFGC